MRSRRPRVLTVALVAIAATALTSCGFNYATDREYTPAAGVNDRSGDPEVLAAVVVSAQQGSGTFVASLVNATAESVSLTEVTSDSEGAVTAQDFEAIEIKPDSLVNLADPAANIVVTGDFEAGNFVSIALRFDNGQTSTLDVPVVDDAGSYEGMDASGGATPASETPTTTGATP